MISTKKNTNKLKNANINQIKLLSELTHIISYLSNPAVPVQYFFQLFVFRTSVTFGIVVFSCFYIHAMPSSFIRAN